MMAAAAMMALGLESNNDGTYRTMFSNSGDGKDRALSRRRRRNQIAKEERKRQRRIARGLR
jgi:hypothetical protein